MIKSIILIAISFLLVSLINVGNEQVEFVTMESKTRCSCFKKVLRDEKKSQKQAERAQKMGDETMYGFIPVDSCYVNKRKPDVAKYIASMDSISLTKFEKDVMKNIRKQCPDQLSQMKKLGYKFK